MSRSRDRDLERWDRGELSTSALLELHRGGVTELVALHRRLSALGTVPVADPEAGWRTVRERMTDLPGHRRTAQFRRRLTRPLAIAAATVLLAGTAYATSPDTVQRYASSFWQKVQTILEDGVPAGAPADAERPPGGGRQDERPGALVDDIDDDRRGPDDDGDGMDEFTEGEHRDDPDEEPESDDGDEHDGEPNDEGDGDDEGDGEGDGGESDGDSEEPDDEGGEERENAAEDEEDEVYQPDEPDEESLDPDDAEEERD